MPSSIWVWIIYQLVPAMQTPFGKTFLPCPIANADHAAEKESRFDFG
jgi:hypothetical protein